MTWGPLNLENQFTSSLFLYHFCSRLKWQLSSNTCRKTTNSSAKNVRHGFIKLTHHLPPTAIWKKTWIMWLIQIRSAKFQKKIWLSIWHRKPQWIMLDMSFNGIVHRMCQGEWDEMRWELYFLQERRPLRWDSGPGQWSSSWTMQRPRAPTGCRHPPTGCPTPQPCRRSSPPLAGRRRLFSPPPHGRQRRSVPHQAWSSPVKVCMHWSDLQWESRWKVNLVSYPGAIEEGCRAEMYTVYYTAALTQWTNTSQIELTVSGPMRGLT